MKCAIMKKYSFSKSNADSLFSIKDQNFAYNRLYQEETVDDQKPFETTINDKMSFLERIPAHNIKLLENFKKNQ